MIYLVMGAVGALVLAALLGVVIGLLLARYMWESTNAYRPRPRPVKRVVFDEVGGHAAKARGDGDPIERLKVTPLPRGPAPGARRRRNGDDGSARP